MTKRISALLLSVILCFSLVGNAFAAAAPAAEFEASDGDPNITVKLSGLTENGVYSLCALQLKSGDGDFKNVYVISLQAKDDGTFKKKLTVDDAVTPKKGDQLRFVISGEVIGEPYTVEEAAKTVTVKFVDTDGNPIAGITDQTVKVGETIKEPTPAPTKEGYEFLGWTNDGTNLWDFTTPVTKEMGSILTLTAMWKKTEITEKGFTITFYLDKASTTAYATLTTEADGTVKTGTWPANPTLAGYTFQKWIDANGKTWTGSSTFAESMSLYASWTKDGGSSQTGTPSSGGGGGGSSTPSYRVGDVSTSGGKVTVSPSSASKGDEVTLTVKPASGFELESITVIDSKGNEIELTRAGDNKFTFIMPAGKVEVKPVFVRIGQAPAVPQASSFSDVPAGAFYADAVAWAVARGITNGTTATTFSPNASCTRAQMVTFLWRAAGSPAPKGAAKGFTDTSAGSFYYNAVLWAVEQGITTGTTETTFSPNATCTRAQTVTFLYRFAGSPAAGSASFSDVSAGSYYANAVAWAVAQGVTNGTTAATFSPNNNCTRGQIVTFLYRYMA